METKSEKYNVKAEICKSLSKIDLQELCDATEEAIIAGGGFDDITSTIKDIARLLKGVLLIPAI